MWSNLLSAYCLQCLAFAYSALVCVWAPLSSNNRKYSRFCHLRICRKTDGGLHSCLLRRASMEAENWSFPPVVSFPRSVEYSLSKRWGPTVLLHFKRIQWYITAFPRVSVGILYVSWNLYDMILDSRTITRDSSTLFLYLLVRTDTGAHPLFRISINEVNSSSWVSCPLVVILAPFLYTMPDRTSLPWQLLVKWKMVDTGVMNAFRLKASDI